MKAVALWIAGGIVALVVVLGLLGDLMAPARFGDTEGAQAGFRVGSLVGTAVRTAIGGAIALALLKAAARARNPSGKSQALEELEAIVASRRAEIPASIPEGVSEYQPLSDGDLLDVYGHINAQTRPDRFQALLWVISQRVDAAQAALVVQGKAPNMPSV